MINQLNVVYNKLNKKLFQNKLPRPLFRIDITSKPVFRYRGIQSNEIIIGSEFSTVSYDDIFDNLLHVMVHIANYESGIEDCTLNQYHKKEFCKLALEKGLVVIKVPSRGWGMTTSRKKIWSKHKADCTRHPDKKATKFRENVYKNLELNSVIFSQFKKELKNKISAISRKQFQLKYVCSCPPPHNSIRSGRRPSGENRLNIKCLDCGSKFKVV